MIRVEYQTTTANGAKMNHIVFCDSCEEAETICSKCDEYGYKIIDVSNYVEEPEEDN